MCDAVDEGDVEDSSFTRGCAVSLLCLLPVKVRIAGDFSNQQPSRQPILAAAPGWDGIMDAQQTNDVGYLHCQRGAHETEADACGWL